MYKTNVQILEESRMFLTQSIQDKQKYITKKGAFSNPRKLSFMLVVLFILQLPKRSLSVEIEDFFEKFNPGKEPCTKSALSQARYKLDSQIYVDWNIELLRSFYTGNDERVKHWNDYKLHGVDGTTIQLPNHKSLIAEFGEHPNQFVSVPMVRVVGRYDLLNELMIETKLGGINEGEITLASDQLPKVPKDVISIYDRHYASFAFIYEHTINNLSFIIRCKSNFNNVVKDFVASGKETENVEFNPSDKSIARLKMKEIFVTKKERVTVRLVRVELESGELEILITSLFDVEKFPNRIFSFLYNSRWGSETGFDILKNKLQVAIFSGQKPEAIRQEIHATIFIQNLNSILISDCEEKEKEVSQRREHEYKINKNVSIGIMRSKIIDIFTISGSKLSILLKLLKDKFMRHLEPVRPGRNYPRKFRSRAVKSKYITTSNYARAF